MNQENKQVRQITPEEVAQAEGLPVPMTPEELQKTQVLNLQELENTIRIEKITSKKPAIVVAVIGIVLLAFGTTFQLIANMNTNKDQKVETRKVEKVEEKVYGSLKCVKTTLNNPNGTNVTYNLDFDFENDKLIKISKKYALTAVTGNKTGEETIKTSLDTYQKLLNGITGYQVDLTSDKTTNLIVTVKIDFNSVDLTKISQENQTNTITKVDYNKYTEKTKIKEEILKQGFTCE